MHPGDQSTNDPAYDTPTLQTTLFPLPVSHPLPIREFLTTDQPRYLRACRFSRELRRRSP
jgi:hypothetical protein